MSEKIKSEIELLFQEDLDIYSSELIEMDELYSEMKKHFDKVKTSTSPGGLNFLQKQAENLISLKSSKMSIVKDRVNTKKVMTELNMKHISATKEDGKTDEAFTNIANQVYGMILSNSKEDLIKSKVQEAEPIDEEALDKELDARLQEEQISNTVVEENEKETEEVVVVVNEETKEEEIIEPDNEEEEVIPDEITEDDIGSEEDDIDYLLEQRMKEENIIPPDEITEYDIIINNEESLEEHRNYHYVTDMKGELIAVDEDYNQITDIEMPNWKISFSIEDEEVVARNEHGEQIEIVEFN